MTMENSDDIRLIVKIAQLYYEQDMTQAQIARELGIYRTTISRLLKRGREQGIVTIAINYDYNENLWLEQQLKQKFALQEVVVAASDALQEEDQLNLIGQRGRGMGFGQGVAKQIAQVFQQSFSFGRLGPYQGNGAVEGVE